MLVIKKVIHWIGPEKPWNSNAPLSNYWKKYYYPFLNQPLVKRKKEFSLAKFTINIDRSIGLIGIYIKSVSPRLYSTLVKLKPKKKIRG